MHGIDLKRKICSSDKQFLRCEKNFNSRTWGSLTKEGYLACCLRLLLAAIVVAAKVAAVDVAEANGSSYGGGECGRGGSWCGIGSKGKRQHLRWWQMCRRRLFVVKIKYIVKNSKQHKFFRSQKLVSQYFGYTALHNNHARHPSKAEIIHCSSPRPNIKLRDHTPFTLSQQQHLNAIPTQIFLFVFEQSSSNHH
jgi:hypothetical protein